MTCRDRLTRTRARRLTCVVSFDAGDTLNVSVDGWTQRPPFDTYCFAFGR
jgi:hypothetical protein